MRVTKIDNQTVSAAGRMRSALRHAEAGETPNTDAPTSDSRALIPLSPARPSEPAFAAVRQPAAFLAHLIATRHTLPQTRERRRAEPKLASSAYSQTRSLVLTQTSHMLSRVA